VPRADDSPLVLCSKKPVGQSGVLGLLSGDAVTGSVSGWENSRWIILVGGGNVEGRVCNADEGGGSRSGQTAFCPAEVMDAERCRRGEQGFFFFPVELLQVDARDRRVGGLDGALTTPL